MPTEIKDKFGSSTAFTITLANLATGVAKQSTIVDNTTDRFTRVIVYAKIKQGSTPTGNRTVTAYLIRDDNHGTNHRTDGAGASDATITIQNAQLIGVMNNKSSPTAGDVLYGEFVIDNPGPKWGIAIQNDTGANLDNTGSNHWVRYLGINPEAQ
ncbi:MAG TPA: hypothetical protein VGH19_02540 [Verrucomicrobiae bacterium]